VAVVWEAATARLNDILESRTKGVKLDKLEAEVDAVVDRHSVDMVVAYPIVGDEQDSDSYQVLLVCLYTMESLVCT
jgi:hypothetical protein